MNLTNLACRLVMVGGVTFMWKSGFDLVAVETLAAAYVVPVCAGVTLIAFRLSQALRLSRGSKWDT